MTGGVERKQGVGTWPSHLFQPELLALRPSITSAHVLHLGRALAPPLVCLGRRTDTASRSARTDRPKEPHLLSSDGPSPTTSLEPHRSFLSFKLKPSLFCRTKPARPIVLVFPRHVGCPFAERDIHQLVHLVLASPSRFVLPQASSPPSTADDALPPPSSLKLQFLIVPHADVSNSREWFATILHAAFDSFPLASPSSPKPDPSLIQEHFGLFPDGSSRSLAKSFGIGSLPSFSSFAGSSIFASVSALKKQGIANRSTASGADRWATHGACAVDAEGVVRWSWVAERADEEGLWDECVKSLGL